MASIVSMSIGFSLAIPGLAENTRVFEATKGWAMSPVHESVKANPLRRIWNGVLGKVFFQIAARISAFLTTATDDKTVMMIEVQKVKTHRRESHSCPVSSTLQCKF